MALGSYLGELKTQVHKFTCSPSQSRPRSSERWFLGDSWAGGLRPRFCANVNDLLNIRCSGKRRHAQLSKQWGRGTWKPNCLFSWFWMQASSPMFWKIYSITPGMGRIKSPASCLSLPASVVKPSAERKELCYIWAIRWEGSQSPLLRHILTEVWLAWN